MRRAINELAANDRLRFEMAQNAQARLVENNLDTRARAKRLAALSRELLAEKIPAASSDGSFANPAVNQARLPDRHD
jgi:hypothetical protein